MIVTGYAAEDQKSGIVQRIKQKYFIRTRKKSKNKPIFSQFRGELKNIAKTVPQQQLTPAQIQAILARQQAQQQMLLQMPRQPFESSNLPSPNKNFFEHFPDDIFDDGDGIKLRFCDIDRKGRLSGGTGSCFGLY